jgi:chromosome segregation ATPase
MRKQITLCSVALCLAAGLLTSAPAQSRPRPVPTLTNEDVTASPEPGETAAPAKGKFAKPAAQTAAAPAQSKDESDWNDRFRKAQEKAAGLERRADGVELEIARLRNQLFDATPKDAGAGNEISARMAQMSRQLQSLREEAKQAQAEVEALKQEGKEKQYKLAEGSAKLPDGSPNLSYYQSRQAELSQELRDADQRMQVIQLRINDLNTRIRKNSGGLDEKGRTSNTSDAFAIRRLKSALQEEQKKLEEIQEKKTETTRKLEELHRQAVNAGIRPGDLN